MRKIKKNGSKPCLVRARQKGRSTCYYQTSLVVPNKATFQEIQTAAEKARWVSIRRVEGEIVIEKCTCPQFWYLHNTNARFFLTREEYEKIRRKLIHPEIVPPVSRTPRKINWLLAGSKHKNDWVKIYDDVGVDPREVSQERLRAELVRLAAGDESKCKPYGDKPDEVMFFRAWLAEIAGSFGKSPTKTENKP